MGIRNSSSRGTDGLGAITRVNLAPAALAFGAGPRTTARNEKPSGAGAMARPQITKDAATIPRFSANLRLAHREDYKSVGCSACSNIQRWNRP